MKHVVCSSLMLLFLLACTPQQEGQPVQLTPFAGGTEGVTIVFQDLPANVYEKEEFNAFVKVENKGETDIKKEDITVKIAGFDQFQTTVGTKKRLDEDLLSVKKDPQGNVIPGIPVTVDFTANYLDRVTTLAEFNVQASACYTYESHAVSKLCVRQDLQNPAPGGLCVVDEKKPSSASGAPIQITNFVEQPSGSSKIQFHFDVTHTGGGVPYKLGHDCSPLRALQNKIFLKVDTSKDGTTCTQLKTREGTAVSGEVDLTGGSRTIFCTIPIDKKNDFEFPVKVSARYSYEISTAVQKIIVKESR